MSKRTYTIDGSLFETAGGNETEDGSIVAEPTADTLIRAVFDIGDCDLRTYEALRECGTATTDRLAGRLDRDRSNVSRSLGRLLEASFVTRCRRVLEQGGQVYQYTAEPPEEVLRAVEEGLDRWVHTGYSQLMSRLLDGDARSQPKS